MERKYSVLRTITAHWTLIDFFFLVNDFIISSINIKYKVIEKLKNEWEQKKNIEYRPLIMCMPNTWHSINKMILLKSKEKTSVQLIDISLLSPL